MRSDSELLIYIFRSEKRVGLLMQSDFAKFDGIKSDLRIRWSKSSDVGPKSDDSTHRNIKSKNGIALQSSKNLTVQSRLVQQQYEVRTKVRVAIDALDYEKNHDERTQSPRLTAARLQLAVGRRGLGPREHREQRTQRASFVATYHAKVHPEQQLSCWARMLC